MDLLDGKHAVYYWPNLTFEPGFSFYVIKDMREGFCVVEKVTLQDVYEYRLNEDGTLRHAILGSNRLYYTVGEIMSCGYATRGMAEDQVKAHLKEMKRFESELATFGPASLRDL